MPRKILCDTGVPRGLPPARVHGGFRRRGSLWVPEPTRGLARKTIHRPGFGGAGGGAAPIFKSNWDTATGSTDAALRDTSAPYGPWDAQTATGSIMTVVSGSGLNMPAGLTNALRCTQHGATDFCEVTRDNFLGAVGTDFYLRVFFRNDDTSGSEDHIISAKNSAGADNSQCIYQHTTRGASTWRTKITFDYQLTAYPHFRWDPSGAAAFNNGHWYRLEWWVHWVDNTHIQVHPRIYDDTSTLIISDADYRQEDYPGSGTDTLASWYGAGNSHGVGSIGPATDLLHFYVGNNGQSGATNTGLFWYFAGVMIRTDTWCGAGV